MKPSKPYPEFPLFPHATKRWAKKIRGKTHYFGPWDDPDGALEKYLSQKDELHSGFKPRPDANAVTVVDVADAFLFAKEQAVKLGELSQRTWDDYMTAARVAVETFGKRRLVVDLSPDDFAALRSKMAKRWGYYRLAKSLQCIRSMFKFADDSDLIDRSVHFGPGFKRPSKKSFRLHRAAQGPNLFTAEEIRRLIDAAYPNLRAMVLLGINCGFGNSDCGHLPASAIASDWIDFPRPKTGVPRRCPLWPETVAAIKAARGSGELVFITNRKKSYAKTTADNPITKETAKLLRKLHINGRKRLGFYTLRHTFRTVADETKDQPAVDFIMGHESPHMSSAYRETISDDRLLAVTNHVRRWLFEKIFKT